MNPIFKPGVWRYIGALKRKGQARRSVPSNEGDHEGVDGVE